MLILDFWMQYEEKGQYSKKDLCCMVPRSSDLTRTLSRISTSKTEE